MSAKHTPGPWKARHTPSRVPNVPDLWCIDWSEDQEEVAEIVHGEADARLIAAAPDLLAALESVIEGCKYGEISQLPGEFCWKERATPSIAALDKARDAIAKARGEQP